MKKKKNLTHRIFTKKEIKRINKKISMLGESCKFDVYFFLNMRLFSSIVLFLVVLYVFEWGYLLSPIITFIYYYLFYYVLIELNLKNRCNRLESEAMEFFEVMTLSIESGNTLIKSLEISCSNVDSELSREFKKSLDEVTYGKSLNEALSDLKRRIPSDTVNNIILLISQSSIFGNNITKDMYQQIDYIRDLEIGKMKSKISKIPLRVSVLSVLFYIPLILLLILSPILIEFLS